MMNFKKLAAGTAIALVVGISAIAGNMSLGTASADGPRNDPYVNFNYIVTIGDSDTAAALKVPGRLKWENVVLSGP